ncbi:myo-inosose-2 dehydratase [Paracoccus aerodenitrificans]|uniref:myo-inosose-2 dehydratase n=1 Tax=Paracoccus aerodenitrificans TaxID=3017781 RepID=UPI0022F03ABD|nr:myo-inosose-2 dehydratase [Paracoccus aerodenitrificans]WBU63628.1 myo-inosose-2 dehydratase [Paracoccus aerodenitrificans]
MIRYGTNPIAWSNDDDQSIGAHISLEDCLSDCREIGFDGIEKGHKMPSDGDELKSALDAYGLRFIGGWHSSNILATGSTPEVERAAMDAHIAMSKAAGSDLIIICECSNSVHGNDQVAANDRPILTDDEWDRLMTGINDLAAHASAQGMRFCYHHHVGSCVESADDIDRFMAAAGPDVYLLLDTGHASFGGADPEELARRYIDRVGHIHCKNIRQPVMETVRAEGLSFIEGVRRGAFTVPGDPDGCVDFAPVLRIAAKAGYDGWLVIEAEQDPELRDPRHYQSMGHDALRRMAVEAGLDRDAAA